jgi:hypothetical protein
MAGPGATSAVSVSRASVCCPIARCRRCAAGGLSFASAGRLACSEGGNVTVAGNGNMRLALIADLEAELHGLGEHAREITRMMDEQELPQDAGRDELGRVAHQTDTVRVFLDLLRVGNGAS